MRTEGEEEHVAFTVDLQRQAGVFSLKEFHGGLHLQEDTLSMAIP
jgi:hypothetical protein